MHYYMLINNYFLTFSTGTNGFKIIIFRHWGFFTTIRSTDPYIWKKREAGTFLIEILQAYQKKKKIRVKEKTILSDSLSLM